ncbi:valine--tRNA ligase [Candidatus Nomurabacteria bacterium]|nr:valine--tRNA ligase [Candidatus Nomurabacteria bacterium]
MKEMEKAYEPSKFEDEIYQKWIDSGFFNPDNLEGEPFSVMMPPPNVTGILHLGHALENSLMDLMVRYQRMQGKKVLLLPGTDHAAVATQAKVEGLLVKEGIEHPREELGREELLSRIRTFAEDSKATILGQIRKLGTSADWSRLRYTFDDDRNRAVNEIFKRMYDDGLIYRGTRLINWSIGAQSVLSDDELEWDEKQEPFYYIRCGNFVIGTVRPETKCANSPLVVHPEGVYVKVRFTNADGETDELILSKNLFDDKEQMENVLSALQPQSEFVVIEEKMGKELEGQTFEYETYAGSRTFTVLADEVIDMEKGAGAMTISSNHSADDYDLANRRGLDETFIQKIDFSGKMTSIAGELEGETIESARKKSVQIMKDKGLIVGEDVSYVHRVPLCYRTKTVIEPMVSNQWFVDVNKKFVLKQSKLKDIKAGQEVTLKELMQTVVRSGEVNILPDRYNKTYFEWIDNLRDWCISRQIWWGHRIPVWYRGEEVYCGVEAPQGDGWTQDEDTLDTWFSSGLWTFSTLGWPDQTEDLKLFHPTNWMQMGWEILFFWMARMILMTTYAIGEIPFSNVYIHGMLRDKDGKKFSKSAGNGIDPLEMIEQYGADALRYSLVTGCTPGNDSRFYIEKVEDARNLVNKLWNLSRFMKGNIRESALTPEISQMPQAYTLADQWVIQKLQNTITQVNTLVAEYQFTLALEKLREFTWNDVADWYLEIAKRESEGEEKSEILNVILSTLLRLWHPFMPFVTEAIWQNVYGEEQIIMVAPWPKAMSTQGNEKIENQFEIVRSVITGLRNIRGEYNIPYTVDLSVSIETEEFQVLLDSQAQVIQKLLKLQSFTIAPQIDKTDTMVSFVDTGVTVYVDLAGAVDFEKEKERIQKEIDGIEPYVIAQEKKLSNESFVSNAPEAVVNQEKEKLAKAKENLKKLKEQQESFV